MDADTDEMAFGNDLAFPFVGAPRPRVDSSHSYLDVLYLERLSEKRSRFTQERRVTVLRRDLTRRRIFAASTVRLVIEFSLATRARWFEDLDHPSLLGGHFRGSVTVISRTLAALALTLTLACGCACNGSANESVTLEYAKGPLTEAGVTSTLTIDDDWGTGFCGSVSIVNKGERPVRDWRVVLQRNGAEFGRMWSGLTVESSRRVLVTPSDDNASIPVGATVSVPFCGSGTGRPALHSMSVDTADVAG